MTSTQEKGNMMYQLDLETGHIKYISGLTIEELPSANRRAVHNEDPIRYFKSKKAAVQYKKRKEKRND